MSVYTSLMGQTSGPPNYDQLIAVIEKLTSKEDQDIIFRLSGALLNAQQELTKRDEGAVDLPRQLSQLAQLEDNQSAKDICRCAAVELQQLRIEFKARIRTESEANYRLWQLARILGTTIEHAESEAYMLLEKLKDKEVDKRHGVNAESVLNASRAVQRILASALEEYKWCRTFEDLSDLRDRDFYAIPKCTTKVLKDIRRILCRSKALNETADPCDHEFSDDDNTCLKCGAVKPNES